MDEKNYIDTKFQKICSKWEPQGDKNRFTIEYYVPSDEFNNYDVKTGDTFIAFVKKPDMKSFTRYILEGFWNCLPNRKSQSDFDKACDLLKERVDWINTISEDHSESIYITQFNDIESYRDIIFGKHAMYEVCYINLLIIAFPDKIDISDYNLSDYEYATEIIDVILTTVCKIVTSGRVIIDPFMTKYLSYDKNRVSNIWIERIYSKKYNTDICHEILFVLMNEEEYDMMIGEQYGLLGL